MDATTNAVARRAGTPVAPAQVTETMARLAQVRERLADALDRLESRLIPVCRGPEPSDAPALAAARAGGLVPLAAELDNLADMYAMQLSRVEDLTNRLEL